MQKELAAGLAHCLDGSILISSESDFVVAWPMLMKLLQLVHTQGG